MMSAKRELMDRHDANKIVVLCVQETRWKGSKARSIGTKFEVFYYVVDRKKLE